MDPDNVIGMVIPLLIILGIGAAIAAGVYMVQTARRGERLEFPTRSLFRLYLSLLSIVSLLLMVGGVGHLVNAGMASALSRDFSYYPQYSNDDYAPRVPLSKGEVLQSQQDTLQTRQTALDERQRVLGAKQDVTQAERDATLAEQTRLDEERSALQGEWAVYQEEQDVLQAERDKKGLKRAFQEGLLKGISFTVFGGILWGAHVWGRRRVETTEERTTSLLNRVYMLMLLLIFGIITVSSLPSRAFESLRFYVLDNNYGQPPGKELSTAIVALPIWLLYLKGNIKAIHS
jgi:hypothetical protein